VKHVKFGETVELSGRLDRSATFSGQVIGSWQAMELDPPTVSAFGPSVNRILSTEVDPDGSFSFRLFVPGEVCVGVGFGGHRLRWIGGNSFPLATRFDVRPGWITDGIDVQESGILCRFEGLGTDPGGALQVILQSREWATGYVMTGGNSQPIPNLDPGTYFLHVVPDSSTGLREQWYDGQDSIESATPIAITQPGEVVAVTVHMTPAEECRPRLQDQ
jgi:hypothetical protein